MKTSLAALLRCPDCGTGRLRDAESRLECLQCNASFEVRNQIPRFVPENNYARSFGFQWNRHARTQLDRFSGNASSGTRFFEVTGWSADLRGQRLLEAGSGSGRFTAIAVGTGAQVVSFDYSDAVDANHANHGSHDTLALLQADIYRIPLERRSFDKVLCLGVLQHCPDPRAAFRNLVTYLAPGGEIVIDVYSLRLHSLLHPRYWLRPFTTRMPRELLYQAVERVVPILLPIKRLLADRVPLGKLPAYLIPVAYQREWQELGDRLSARQLRELSILDTFDWLSPAYDRPQTLRRVQRWFEACGLIDISVSYGANGVVGRGTRAHAG